MTSRPDDDEPKSLQITARIADRRCKQIEEWRKTVHAQFRPGVEGSLEAIAALNQLTDMATLGVLSVEFAHQVNVLKPGGLS